MTMNLIEIREIRKLVASIYWSANKDYKMLRDFHNMKHETCYEVGMMIGYLKAINKDELADKIYDKFMEN